MAGENSSDGPPNGITTLTSGRLTERSQSARSRGKRSQTPDFLRPGEPGEPEQRSNHQQRGRPGKEAEGSAARQEKVADGGDAAQDEDQVSEAPPFKLDFERPPGQEVHEYQHDQVCTAQGDAGPGDPEPR